MGSTSSKNAQAASTTTTTTSSDSTTANNTSSSSNQSVSSTSSSSLQQAPTPLTDYSSSSANTAAFGGSSGGGGAEAGMMAAPRKIRARHRFRRTRGVIGKSLNKQAEVARPAAEQGGQEEKKRNGERVQESEAVDEEHKRERQGRLEQQRQELEQEVQELLQDDERRKDDTEQERVQGRRSSGTKRRLSASSSVHGDGSPHDGSAQKLRNISIAPKAVVERDPGDDEIANRHDELKKKLPLFALTKEQERFELMERQRRQQEELRLRLERQQSQNQQVQQAQYRNVYQPQPSTETPSFLYPQPTPIAYPHPNAYGKPLPLYEPPLSVPAIQHAPALPLTTPHVPALMVQSQLPSLSPPSAQDGNFRVLPANQFVSTAPESFYRPNATSPITPPAPAPQAAAAQMNSPTVSLDGVRYSDLSRRRTIFENPIPADPPKPTDEPYQYRRIKILSNGTLTSKVAQAKSRRPPWAKSFPTLQMMPASNSLQVNGRSILSDPVPLVKPKRGENGRSVIADPGRVHLVKPTIEDSDNNNDNSISTINSNGKSANSSSNNNNSNSNNSNNSSNNNSDDESNGSSKDYEEAFECRCGHAFATKGNINRHLRTLRYDPDHMQFVHPNNVVYSRIFPRTRLTQAEYNAIRAKKNEQKSA